MTAHPRGAAEGTHDAVAERAALLPARGLLLDAPCGDGRLAIRFARLGFRVVGLDREPPSPEAREFRAIVADLDAPLPFCDAAFDAAVSVEGVEHLRDPARYLAELGRVVKSGGTLILTTPNVLNWRSRVRYLFRGYHDYFRPEPSGPQPYEHGHTRPVDWIEIRHGLARAGFDVAWRGCNREIAPPLLARVALLPWIRRRARRKHPFASEILSPEIAAGEILVVECRRR